MTLRREPGVTRYLLSAVILLVAGVHLPAAALGVLAAWASQVLWVTP